MSMTFPAFIAFSHLLTGCWLALGALPGHSLRGFDGAAPRRTIINGVGRFEFTDVLILLGIQVAAVFIGFAVGRDIPRQKRLMFAVAALTFVVAFIAHIITFRFLPAVEPPAVRPDWHRLLVAAVWGLTSGLTVELVLRPPWLVSLICGVAATIGYGAFVYLR